MKQTIRKAIALFAILTALFAFSSMASAQGKDGSVGQALSSTNTPGGGGEPTVTMIWGEQTDWFIADVAPTTAGTAISNVLITYYKDKESRDNALAERKKKKQAEEEAKKKKDGDKKDDGKKKGDDKKDGGKKKGDGKNPPDVPTFDPRFYRLDENGKVVKNDVIKPGTIDPHQWCEAPAKFECGEHYQWWLKNHEHRTEMPKSFFDLPTDNSQGKRIIMTGTVIAGQPTQVAVVDSKGAVCSGEVIALPDGSTVKTNDKGIATILVPAGLAALTLSLADSHSSASAWVKPSGTAGNVVPGGSASGNAIEQGTTTPTIDIPEVCMQGEIKDFSFETTNNCAMTLDGKALPTLAESQGSAVCQLPINLAPGTHVLAILDGNELKALKTFDVAALQVEAPKTMAIGQKATYSVRVIGTDRAVKLAVMNGSPTVVSMTGAASDGMIESCGGKNNIAKIDVKALSPGAIQLPVRIFGF